MPIIAAVRDVSCLIGRLNTHLGGWRQRDGRDASARSSESYVSATLFAGRKPVLRGVLEQYWAFPASPPLSDELLAYLTRAIPGERDILVGEDHGFGWHYHYCDRAERRSDVIMSFDSRTTKSQGVTAVHPLRWEPHAVNKARFQARPFSWRDRKRSSVYAACAGDLNTKQIQDFKTPSANAQDLWP